MAESCRECGRFTLKGLQECAETARKYPLYGTNFSHPLSKIIEHLRDRMSFVRGQIGDIESAFPGLKEMVHPVGELLTCGIHFLYDSMKEMEEIEEKNKNDDSGRKDSST